MQRDWGEKRRSEMEDGVRQIAPGRNEPVGVLVCLPNNRRFNLTAMKTTSITIVAFSRVLSGKMRVRRRKPFRSALEPIETNCRFIDFNSSVTEDISFSLSRKYCTGVCVIDASERRSSKSFVLRRDQSYLSAIIVTLSKIMISRSC